MCVHKGLPLRTDIHRIFDSGLITVNVLVIKPQ
ncbi:HNH endonuclease [Aminipila terrae]